MEAGSSSGVGSPEISLDYSFGFENVNFSDRTLLLEIIDDPKTEADLDNNPNEPDPDENLSESDSDDSPNEPDPDEIRSETIPNDKVLENAIGATPLPRVKTIRINSLILAARSPFFHKLFSNGMRESEQRHITLQIEAQEEVSFMDLLIYIYSNRLPTTLFALLDLMEIADKFEVVSCLRDCSRSLQNNPMTFESASYYLDLSPSLLMSDTIKPLIDAAKKFLIAQFKHVERFKEEVLSLPLAGIQAVLSSDDLRVASEGVVYDLVLKWASKHYPVLEERRGIIKTHLLHLISFPSMTTAKLMEVLTCKHIDPELTSKIVIQALHFKAETPHRQHCLAAEKDNAASRQYVERVYTFRPVKVLEFELTRQQCTTVNLDLKWEEVSRMFPDGHIYSENFHLGGQELCLIVQCFSDKQTSVHCFYLSLLMQVAGSAAYTVECHIASRMKPSEEFVSNSSGSYTFDESPGNFKPLFRAPWSVFVAVNSPYFINGVLHLKADLRINK